MGNNGAPVASYDKRFLVPGGEYIPREDNFIIRRIVEEYSRSLQGKARTLEPGVQLTLFPVTAQGRTWHFTSSICYEYVWPQCFVDLHRREDGKYPDFHINISNEGWFKQSAELDMALSSRELVDDWQRMVILVDPSANQPDNLIWKYYWTVRKEMEKRSEDSIQKARKLAQDEK